MPTSTAPLSPAHAGRYGAVAIAFHWLLALAIVGAFGVGLYMADLPFSLTRVKLYNWHKWTGVTILMLSGLRLLWRLTHRPPADLPMPAWQARAAHLTHGLLYILFFGVPLAGWAYSSATGFPIVWFGVIPLPDFVPKDKELAEALKALHKYLAYGLAGLVLAHVGGAVKHQFVDRDGLLRRMLRVVPDRPLESLLMKKLLTIALLALSAPFAFAQAKLLPAQSELGFTSKQMGVPVDGKFKRFDAQLAFDPKKPETGKVAFTIDMASASLGDAAVDAELVKADWFDAKKSPQASFQSTAVKATGAGKFEVAGKLTIKGQVRDIVVPISLTQAGAVSTATGGFVLKRLAFKIGQGDWTDTSVVADDVQVKFKLAFNGIPAL